MNFVIHCFKPFVRNKPRVDQELELIGRYISWQGDSYRVVEADRPVKSSAGVWVTCPSESATEDTYVGGFHQLIKYYDTKGLLLI